MRSFENANPLALAVYFFAVSGISMFCMNPLLLFLSLTGAVLYYFVRSGRKRMKSHLWSLGLFLVLVVLNPLVSHNGVTVLFVLNHNPVTLEAAVYGYGRDYCHGMEVAQYPSDGVSGVSLMSKCFRIHNGTLG